ncbi:sulfatase [uncultured Bacteroides sp.]|uniref:sulfatase n=1 Tax=uncultured Bacteroides sp. TaxID=162156 RepID=UPI002618D35D|nr:sulfatase [uncultured Bacteroides sp.]
MNNKSLLCLMFLSSVTLYSQDRPNIVVFLVDDMGVMDTSVPFITDSNGTLLPQPLNNWYRTPNMERLAEQGARFSTFYAQSVSSPSRISIMTGQNSARHHTTNWISENYNNRNDYGPKEWNWKGLNSSSITYPSLLKSAGYRTIHIGKAHFGCNQSEGKDPKVIGFDINVAGCAIGHPGSYHGENGYGWIKGQRTKAVPDLEEYHGTNTFLTDALTNEACKEIKKSVSEGKPFYLNLAHYAVHSPFEKDERFIDNYPKGKKSDNARAFATLIEGMDKSLGDLLYNLEELGVAENTLIFFIGDNGSDAPLGDPEDHASSAPLKGKKGSEYEGGVRVPFIVSWAKPDSSNKFQKKFPIKQNFVQTEIGTIMDVFPTVLSAANVDLPKNHILDGSDIKKLLSGKKDRSRRDDVLMHFPHKHRGSYFTSYRKDKWKIIYYYNPEKGGVPSYKLYNLSDDPYENNDLSSSNPSQLRWMCEQMIKRLENENAQYPVDKEGKTLHPILPDLQ